MAGKIAGHPWDMPGKRARSPRLKQEREQGVPGYVR